MSRPGSNNMFANDVGLRGRLKSATGGTAAKLNSKKKLAPP